MLLGALWLGPVRIGVNSAFEQRFRFGPGF